MSGRAPGRRVVSRMEPAEAILQPPARAGQRGKARRAIRQPKTHRPIRTWDRAMPAARAPSLRRKAAQARVDRDSDWISPTLARKAPLRRGFLLQGYLMHP